MSFTEPTQQAPYEVPSHSPVATGAPAMGELAASVVHELNQPLAAMITSAETCLLWLDRECPDLDRVRNSAQRIVRAGHHAGNVIRGMRTLLGGSSPQREHVQINDLIADVLDLLQDQIARHGVVIAQNLCAGLPRVAGDRVQLQQVLLNLIRNAIESMVEGRPQLRVLEFGTDVDAQGFVHVAVSDSGTGIAETAMPQLFEPFFSTKSNGMGLGLSICQSIVERHGGRIWASARQPRGSTFQFTIPRAEG
jgi:signal transduction histidine kinase